MTEPRAMEPTTMLMEQSMKVTGWKINSMERELKCGQMELNMWEVM